MPFPSTVRAHRTFSRSGSPPGSRAPGPYSCTVAYCWVCVMVGLTLSSSHGDICLHPWQAHHQEKGKKDRHLQWCLALDMRNRAAWSALARVCPSPFKAQCHWMLGQTTCSSPMGLRLACPVGVWWPVTITKLPPSPRTSPALGLCAFTHPSPSTPPRQVFQMPLPKGCTRFPAPLP